MSYINRISVNDSTGVVINPAEDESLALLRRITKLLESNAVIDSSQRQRVVVDQGSANLTVTAAQATAANLNATVTGTVALGAGTANVGQVVVGFGGQATASTNIIDSRFMLIDTARNAYANGIRQNLSWK